MRDDPALDLDEIAACLDAQYDLRVSSVEFLPLGYDLNAAVYKVVARDGTAYFLKIRFGPIQERGASRPLGTGGARDSQRTCSTTNAIRRALVLL